MEIAQNACNYISAQADLTRGVPTILTSSGDYPRAEHWNHPLSIEPSFERLTGIVGLLNWQGINDTWLKTATEVCLDYISNKEFDDAHTILTTYCLLESLPQTNNIKRLYKKLSNELMTARFLRIDASSQNYGLSPLEFAPSPISYCTSIFPEDIIN